MRKVIKAMVLVMALAVPVWAGEMGTPVALSGEIGNPMTAPTSSEPARDGNMGAPRAVSDVLVKVLSTLLALL